MPASGSSRQDKDFGERDGTIGWVGGEIALPRHLYIVGEVSNKDDVFTETPWPYGLQLRRPDGFGLSFAVVQTDQSYWIGIGVNF